MITSILHTPLVSHSKYRTAYKVEEIYINLFMNIQEIALRNKNSNYNFIWITSVLLPRS